MALDDDEYDGYASDTLTVKVGYYGGPYYEKRVFTLDELWNMNVVYSDYTFIDNMPSVVIDHVAGVKLADIIEAAGIDMNSVETFYFWTRDKQSDYYTSYTKKSLIDKSRYCYYSLPDNFDSDAGKGNELATSYGEPVDTVIALADDWNRCIAGATFGSDYNNLNTNTRFRLIFGQTDAVTRTANSSAKWIHEIVVELGGAPTIKLDASVLEGEVGSVLRTEASIAGDSTVLKNQQIEWSSSDESVATVDSNGNITVQGEGSAVITASFAGATASVTVNGTSGENSDSGSGGDTDSSETGSGSQSGNQTDAHVTDSGAGQFQLIEPVGEGQSSTGGVQNWRMYEMSETATELGEIDEDNPLLGVTGIFMACLFVAGMLGEGIVFYVNIGGKNRNVYRTKS
jgi:hypothetical protein